MPLEILNASTTKLEKLSPSLVIEEFDQQQQQKNLVK